MRQLQYLVFLFVLGLGACNNGPAAPQPDAELTTTDSVTTEADPSYFVFRFRDASPTCETADSLRCAVVEVNLLQLKGQGDPAATRINDFLKEIAFEMVADYVEGDSEPKNLGEAAKMFIADYEVNMEDMGEYVTPWSLELNSELLYETDELFTVQLSYYTYTGGAHPNHAIGLFTFDRKTGKEMDLASRIIDKPALNQTVEAAFREAAGLESGESLQEAGYFFGEEFSLPANMALTEEGVLFNYNPYEVAPYALGYTTFTIPYSELEGKLNVEK